MTMREGHENHPASIHLSNPSLKMSNGSNNPLGEIPGNLLISSAPPPRLPLSKRSAGPEVYGAVRPVKQPKLATVSDISSANVSSSLPAGPSRSMSVAENGIKSRTPPMPTVYLPAAVDCAYPGREADLSSFSRFLPTPPVVIVKARVSTLPPAVECQYAGREANLLEFEKYLPTRPQLQVASSSSGSIAWTQPTQPPTRDLPLPHRARFLDEFLHPDFRTARPAAIQTLPLGGQASSHPDVRLPSPHLPPVNQPSPPRPQQRVLSPFSSPIFSPPPESLSYSAIPPNESPSAAQAVSPAPAAASAARPSAQSSSPHPDRPYASFWRAPTPPPLNEHVGQDFGPRSIFRPPLRHLPVPTSPPLPSRAPNAIRPIRLPAPPSSPTPRPQPRPKIRTKTRQSLPTPSSHNVADTQPAELPIQNRGRPSVRKAAVASSKASAAYAVWEQDVMQSQKRRGMNHPSDSSSGGDSSEEVYVWSEDDIAAHDHESDSGETSADEPVVEPTYNIVPETDDEDSGSASVHSDSDSVNSNRDDSDSDSAHPHGSASVSSASDSDEETDDGSDVEASAVTLGPAPTAKLILTGLAQLAAGNASSSARTDGASSSSSKTPPTGPLPNSVPLDPAYIPKLFTTETPVFTDYFKVPPLPPMKGRRIRILKERFDECMSCLNDREDTGLFWERTLLIHGKDAPAATSSRALEMFSIFYSGLDNVVRDQLIGEASPTGGELLGLGYVLGCIGVYGAIIPEDDEEEDSSYHMYLGSGTGRPVSAGGDFGIDRRTDGHDKNIKKAEPTTIFYNVARANPHREPVYITLWSHVIEDPSSHSAEYLNHLRLSSLFAEAILHIWYSSFFGKPRTTDFWSGGNDTVLGLNYSNPLRHQIQLIGIEPFPWDPETLRARKAAKDSIYARSEVNRQNQRRYKSSKKGRVTREKENKKRIEKLIAGGGKVRLPVSPGRERYASGRIKDRMTGKKGKWGGHKPFGPNRNGKKAAEIAAKAEKQALKDARQAA